jgi:aspartyl-tRNA(Asn)/glutamyl-tRNA(Gln) amidotransferase subunit B
MSIYDQYQAVIGLEVHIQLLTKSKAYCADAAEYGADPNTLVSPITLGHPGTLPFFNKQAMEFGIKLGIATNCTINEYNGFARKNYFYADLPKGYQITQDKTPICTQGSILIETKEGDKVIGITRIHLEEDAGKSMHDKDPMDSLVDFNRCGVPLLEMVSEPDLRSAEDAYAYLTEVRKLVRYLDICDGNMEEGSMRCDANISVMKKGATEFGTKVEVKNMNSIRNVQRAIEFEIKRQIDLLEAGESFTSETRSFEATSGTTFSLRSKEAANDYRYFPEPDLPPFRIKSEAIEKVKAGMPALPRELFAKFTRDLGLSDYDARNLTDTKETARYFSEVIAQNVAAKAAANWILGPVKGYLNEEALDWNRLKLAPQKLAELISLVDSGKISFTAASMQVFPELILSPDKSPESIAIEKDLIQESNDDFLESIAKEVLEAWPDKVAEYQSGKKGVLGLFMGDLMKKSKGKADPKKASAILQKLLG